MVTLYIGTKVIAAEPMDELTFLENIRKIDPGSLKNRETRPGYHVRYEDDYTSWSPRDTFERAYRRLTPGELVLLKGA